MTDIERYEKHGSWVGLYAFLSFVSIFVIAYVFRNWIYDKLLIFCQSGDTRQELQCDLASSTIRSVNVDLGFVHLGPCRFMFHMIGVVVCGLVIAYLVRRWWYGGWKFLVPMLLYVSIPLTVIRVDTMGVKLVAFFYAALIYIMRFSLKFNPHRRKIDGQSRRDVQLCIFKIYHQYAILSLAVIGLTLSTFIFGFEVAFREFMEPMWTRFPQIRWPFYVSHALFLGIGITGLALGVCREFHVKQEEMLKNGFD
jgi:hypothetical protein